MGPRIRLAVVNAQLKQCFTVDGIHRNGVLFCDFISLTFATKRHSSLCHSDPVSLLPASLVLSRHITPVASTGSLLLSSLLGLLLLALELFGISPEERVNHDVPRGTSLEGSSKVEDLTSQEPVHEGDGLLSSVVAGDGDVNVLKGRISVTEGNAGDVSIRSLSDGLVVGLGVSDDDETGLHELTSDLVSQGTGGPSLSDGLAASVVGELHDGSGTERSLRADNDVLGVLDGDDNSGGNHELLPSLTEVDNVDVIAPLLIDITLHLEVHIASTNVGLKRP